MTQQEFDNTRFAKGQKAVYGDETYFIRMVNFEERLFGLAPEWVVELDEEDYDPIWVRCESVVFVESPSITTPDDETSVATEDAILKKPDPIN